MQRSFPFLMSRFWASCPCPCRSRQDVLVDPVDDKDELCRAKHAILFFLGVIIVAVVLLTYPMWTP